MERDTIQPQWVHDIMLAGASRQPWMDCREGVWDLPFLFDLPNLDKPDEGHLYYLPGGKRLITIVATESRKHDVAQAIRIPWEVRKTS